MYKGSTVSVVMPAFNEADGIADVVRDFLAQPEVDEVVVIDNNSDDGTAAIAAAAGARVVPESRQGYGYACRAALAASVGDLVILAESDGTFAGRDINKLLVYSEDFDVVFGTRTSKSCIWSGSNMGHFLRYGNTVVAKLVEYAHNGPCLTDVGCTFKLFRRNCLATVLALLTVGGSHLSPELMIVCIRIGLRTIEIPINYFPRIGTSKITGSFPRAFRLGCRMIGLTLAYRLRTFPHVGSSVTLTSLLSKRAGARWG